MRRPSNAEIPQYPKLQFSGSDFLILIVTRSDALVTSSVALVSTSKALVTSALKHRIEVAASDFL